MRALVLIQVGLADIKKSLWKDFIIEKQPNPNWARIRLRLAEKMGFGVLHTAPINCHTGQFSPLYALPYVFYFRKRTVCSRKLLPHQIPFLNHFSHKKSTHLGCVFYGGENGIWTHGTLMTYTRFPIVRLRPLSHFSNM